MEVDAAGRLIVVDGSATSGARDADGDAFQETIGLSQNDANLIVRGESDALDQAMKAMLGEWKLFPEGPAVKNWAPGITQMRTGKKWPPRKHPSPQMRLSQCQPRKVMEAATRAAPRRAGLTAISRARVGHGWVRARPWHALQWFPRTTIRVLQRRAISVPLMPVWCGRISMDVHTEEAKWI